MLEDQLNTADKKIIPSRIKHNASKVNQKLNASLQKSQVLLEEFKNRNLLNIAKLNPLTNAYFREKADTRVLLKLLQSGNLPSSDTQNQVSVSDIKAKFDVVFDVEYTSLPQSDQLSLLYGLMELKNEIFSRLLLHVVGAENMLQDPLSKDPDFISLSSKDMPVVINCIKTFESILKRFKLIELTKAESNFMESLKSKNEEISELRDTNDKLLSQVKDLLSKLQLFSIEGFQQQLISNQSNEIDKLKKDIKSYKTQLHLNEVEKQAILEKQQILKDKFQSCVIQLENSKLLYEHDISGIQPILKEHIEFTYLETKEMSALRNDIELKYLRSMLTETKLEENLIENKQLKFDNETLRREKLEIKSNLHSTIHGLKSKLKQLTNELNELQESHNVQTMDYESLKSKYDHLVVSSHELSEKFDIKLKELSDCEAYIKQLQLIVYQHNDKIQQLEDKLSINKAEFTSQELYIKKLQEMVSTLKSL